jgi:hypothetical protein
LEVGAVAREWGARCGQEYAIVQIRDCRNAQYLGEVTKYVVKPSQLASWPDELIAQFIHAIKGIRFFATFGSLFDQARSVRAQIAAAKDPPAICACGCGEFLFTDERTEILREHRRQK